MQHGCVHKTNRFGSVKILNYVNAKLVEVEFLDSGWRSTFKSCHIRVGGIVDKMQPTVSGVGFIGDGIYKPGSGSNKTNAYDYWSHMMQRCYSDIYHEKFPTYKDCEVCEEWQNFQNFAEWFYDNAPEELGRFVHLDKDIKIKGNKIYSPEACMFVSAYENSAMAMGCYGRVVKLMSPSGKTYEVTNIKEFCIEIDMPYKGFQHLVSGTRKSNHGWVVISLRHIAC